MRQTAVLHWAVTKHYLVSTLAPDAPLISLNPGESAVDAARRLIELGRNPERVLIHLDISVPCEFVRNLDELTAIIENKKIAVWNGRAKDIRKRTIQSFCRSHGLPTTTADRKGSRHEKVIVKTNLNTRGLPEWRLTPAQLRAVGWSAPEPSPLHGHNEYIVLKRGEVPKKWWSNPQGAIERYIDNRYGLFYRVYVVGEQIVVCEGTASTPVRRMSEANDRCDFFLARELAGDELLPKLLETPALEVFLSAVICADLFPLDYGAIDFVVDDSGVPYIVDINLTPFWGVTEEGAPMLEHLRRGLD